MEHILLPYRNLEQGKHHFEMKASQEFFDYFANPEILSGELEVNIDAQRFTHGVTLSVTVKGEVCVECDRCLESCPININFQGETTVREGEYDEQYDEDTIWISASDDQIDLSQYVYESVVLCLPYQRVHGLDENGNSLCNKEMLDKFNIVSAEEFDHIVSSANKENNPEWAKLNELKEKLK